MPNYKCHCVLAYNYDSDTAISTMSLGLGSISYNIGKTAVLLEILCLVDEAYLAKDV
jgi:hypothetical protein